MQQYFKNILRTIIQNKFSYIGAILIIAMGSLINVALSEFLINLDTEAKLYFEECHFADMFATVSGMPAEELSRLENIEGIDSVFGRLEGDVRLLPDDDQVKIITLHILAYSPDDSMNQITLSPVPSEIRDDEIFLSPKIAEIYGIEKGDKLQVIAGGKKYTLLCSGYSYSPEYMYFGADESMMTADNSVYDIASMSVSGLEKLLGHSNTVTSVGFRISQGYSYSDVYHNVEQVLEPYGLEDICQRKDQTAWNVIDEEVESFEQIINIIPTIFMAITIFMLYIIIKKIIEKDRILIGTMKAFGASDSEMLKVYLVQAVFIGLAGGLLFMIPAEFMGKYLFEDDMFFYNIPGRIFKVHPGVWLRVIGIDMVTAVFAVFLGVMDVIRINPAESMRSQAPAGGDVHLPAFGDKLLNSRKKMGLMYVVRNRLRSFVIAVAIASSFALICVLPTYGIVTEKSIDDQFNKIEGYDLKVKLNDYIPYEEAENLVRNIEGVSEGEVIASYSVKLTGTNKYEYAPLMILNPNSELYRIMSYYEKYYEPREDGLIISHHLANKLHVQIGDIVELEGTGLTCLGQPVKMMIVDIVPDTFGVNCYLSGEGIERYFSMNRQGNILLLNIEKGRMDDVMSQIYKLKNISYVIDSNKSASDYLDMMAITILMLNFIAGFAIIAGVLIIYNVMGISIRERINEFGTMMVLGMNISEISEIVFFEQVINFIWGILLGLPMAEIFRQVMIYSTSTDEETLLLRITPNLYLFSFAICAGSLIISVVMNLRHLNKIQLTDVLKVRE